MLKLAQELLQPIAVPVRVLWRNLRSAPATIDHDPNARAGGDFAERVSPGLFGVLVSNRASR